ncbi:MAG: hypothetical protein ACYS47_18435 [Planctomycetota bacterium]
MGSALLGGVAEQAERRMQAKTSCTLILGTLSLERCDDADQRRR